LWRSIALFLDPKRNDVSKIILFFAEINDRLDLLENWEDLSLIISNLANLLG
jgi:hypothetical protein